MATRVSRSRYVKRRNRRWVRQRSVKRGGVDHTLGVLAGVPGSFDPANAVPNNLAELNEFGAFGETIAWTVGQFVVLGNETNAYWNGTAWVAGTAPA